MWSYGSSNFWLCNGFIMVSFEWVSTGYAIFLREWQSYLQILEDRRYSGCHYCECEMCWEDTVVYKILLVVTSHKWRYLWLLLCVRPLRNIVSLMTLESFFHNSILLQLSVFDLLNHTSILWPCMMAMENLLFVFNVE